MKNKITLPCIRGLMGDWIYYSSFMTPQQLTEWVVTSKEIRESEKLDEILQRNLKERRKNALVKYLTNVESRFFNSIIIGVWGGIPEWFQFDITRKTKEIVAEEDRKNLDSSMGLLVFEKSSKMFAIDGQHRVAGIQEAFKKGINSIVEEQYPVILIAHIDDKSGRKRTRKLFSDINTNAQQVSETDKVIINEEDILKIVARKVFAEYPTFKKGKLISLSERTSLAKNNITHFTNLYTLFRVNKGLKVLFKKDSTHEIWEKENVNTFYEIVKKFYDFIFDNIEEYNLWLNKKITLEKAREENKYLLFRPVGLVLLAKLYSYFLLQNNLKKLEKNLHKISFKMPSSPFLNVLWTDGKLYPKESNINLSLDLILYLLGEKVDEEKLLIRYRQIKKDDNQELPPKLIK